MIRQGGRSVTKHTQIMENIKTYSDEVIHEANNILSGKHYDNGSTNIVCLGQTEGSKGIMFVLYNYREDMHSHGNPMTFRAILSNDLLEACERARVLCGDSHIELYNEINGKRLSIELQVENFLKLNPTLVDKLETKHYIIEDIKRHLHKKGRISNSQINLVERIHEDVKTREEKVDKYAPLEKHYFEEKARVELQIKEIISTAGYATMYGYNSIIKYLTECNRVVLYSGTSPKELESGDRIKATIKHNEYKGTEQTLLQRISILK